jgi:hypothetical protein
MSIITHPHGASRDPRLARSSRRALAWLGTVSLAALAACELPADDHGDTVAIQTVDGQAPRDGEILVGATVLADLPVKAGPHLVFIDLAAPGEQPQVGVYEFVPTGHRGTADFPELAGASPLALFLAATGDDIDVPERLREAEIAVKGALRTSPTARGWLRDASVGSRPTALAAEICNDSEFMAAVTAPGYNDSGTPVFRLNQAVGASGYFAEQYYQFPVEGTGTFGQAYYVGGAPGSRWYNIDRYYTRVAVCALGSHPTLYGSHATVVHPGPTVSVRYRDSDDNPFGWGIVLNHDYSGTGYSYWHFYTGTNWDWETLIDLAQDGDTFDIGHAVETL